ncbi:MAG: hypothetical protein H0Z34_03365 [Brevibacillus sp.]|nr:hypothetical protein [Brevibacillus sp.]
MINGRPLYLSEFFVSLPPCQPFKQRQEKEAARRVGSNDVDLDTASLSQPLFALYEEYALPYDDWCTRLTGDGRYAAEGIPTAEAVGAADLAIDSVQKLLAENRLKAGRYLIYAHETIEASLTLTPVLKVKKMCALKETIPFSVSQAGSSSFAAALLLLDCLHATASDDSIQPSLIVTADRLSPPQPRTFFTQYPKGDAAASCLVLAEPDAWEVLACELSTRAMPQGDPYRWKWADFRAAEQAMLDQLPSSIPQFLLNNQFSLADIALVVPQQHSDAFLAHVRAVLKSEALLYRRKTWSRCNLLGSDCLVSLAEAVSNKRIHRHDLVLLIQAGPLASLGFILLRRVT